MRRLTVTLLASFAMLMAATQAPADTIERASVGTGGQEGNGPSQVAGLSGDGQRVVFFSTAPDFAPTDPASRGFNIFLRDRARGTTILVSQNRAGAQSQRPEHHPSDFPQRW